MSYQIGQYFKENADRNILDGGNRPEEGSTTHILAHALLGAVVAAAGDSSALLGAIASGGAEAAAPALAQYLYGKEGKDLNADEKSTISAITGISGAAIGSFGNAANIGQASAAAQNAVNNNWGEVGHYSTMATVLYLAGFSEKDSKAIALAAWGPDTDSRNAMSPDANILTDQKNIHLLDDKNEEGAKNDQEMYTRQFKALLTSLKQYENEPAVKAAILTDPETQRILHAFGDSFAHVQANGLHYPNKQGHLIDSLNGDDPDNPNSHPTAYRNYTLAIYNVARNVTKKSRSSIEVVNRVVTKVVQESSESGQKIVLQNVMNSAGGHASAAISSVKDCGTAGCRNLSPGSQVNPVINSLQK